MGWMIRELGFDSQDGHKLFFTTASTLTLGHTQLPIQWAPGTPAHMVRWSGHDTNDLPPSSAKDSERHASIVGPRIRVGCSGNPLPFYIQWNLYLSFPDNSFSRIRRSIYMVPEQILFQLWLPHLLFSRIHCFFFRPLTKTMNRCFTVYGKVRDKHALGTKLRFQSWLWIKNWICNFIKNLEAWYLLSMIQCTDIFLKLERSLLLFCEDIHYMVKPHPP
jgi:hypothetical protein